MKNMSTFQAILYSVFGLGALIGIFVFATYTGNSGRNAIGSVVIWGTLPKNDINSMLVSETKTNQGLKEVTYVQKDPSTLVAELASAIATASAPDLVLDSQEDLLALEKFVSPIAPGMLSASTVTSTFVDGAGIFASANGYYGMPFLVDPLVLFYNRSILSSSGIAKPPPTWEALIGLVPSIALLTPTRQLTRSFIALGTYTNVHNARGILSSLFLQTGVPVSSRSSTGLLTADLGVIGQNGSTPGQAVVGFYTQFADPSKVSYTWNASLQDSQKSFLTGSLALYLGYASEARYLSAANPNLNFGVAPLPQPATAQNKNAYGLIYTFMIPRGAKNASGAYQVATILSGNDQQSIAADATGLAPASLNALASPPNDANAAISYAEALYAKGWLSPMPSDTDAIFSGMITDVITGRSSLELALSTAEQALTVLLRQ